MILELDFMFNSSYLKGQGFQLSSKTHCTPFLFQLGSYN
jgi:hypothetical protein